MSKMQRNGPKAAPPACPFNFLRVQERAIQVRLSAKQYLMKRWLLSLMIAFSGIAGFCGQCSVLDRRCL